MPSLDSSIALSTSILFLCSLILFYLPRALRDDHFFQKKKKQQQTILDFMSHILACAVCRCVFWQPFVSMSACVLIIDYTLA